MNVLITLTTAGIDTGPFNLYSNTDSYVTAFETGVTKTALVAGYLSTLVPAGTTYVRVKSTGLCTNYIDIYVTGSGTTTTTTTATPTTTTTTTTEVVTYYNVVLCGTSTPSVIRYNGPNNVTLGVVVQSTNGSCYTVSSVGTGPETVGTLLTQFASCGECQVAPPPTTTTTSTSTSTSTTTSTSTSTSTTTTTTTSILTSCEEWRNDTLEEATVTYTPCNSVTPVSNYALSTTSSVCAVYGSITVTVGGPLTLVGSCNTPAPTTTTTTTATPTTTTTTSAPPSYYAFSLTAGGIDSATACADSSAAITLYGSSISFLSNATFYNDYTLLSPYDGSNLYYKNVANNEYVQISSIGSQTAGGSC